MAYDPTDDDIAAILRVYADSDDPLSWFGAARRLAPPPAIRDGRRREHKAWTTRTLVLVNAQMDAQDRGHLAETVAGGNGEPFRCSITPAGRQWLAATDDGPSPPLKPPPTTS